MSRERGFNVLPYEDLRVLNYVTLKTLEGEGLVISDDWANSEQMKEAADRLFKDGLIIRDMFDGWVSTEKGDQYMSSYFAHMRRSGRMFTCSR